MGIFEDKMSRLVYFWVDFTATCGDLSNQHIVRGCLAKIEF